MMAERPKWTPEEIKAIEAYNKEFGTSNNKTYAHWKIAEPNKYYNTIFSWAGLPQRVAPSKINISRSLQDAAQALGEMSSAGASGKKPGVSKPAPLSPILGGHVPATAASGPAAAAGLRGMPPMLPMVNVTINETALSNLLGNVIDRKFSSFEDRINEMLEEKLSKFMVRAATDISQTYHKLI